MNKRIISIVLSLCMVLTCLSIGCFNTVAITTDTESSQALVSTETSSANPYGLVDNIQDGVILHCFNWSYNDIKKELPNIAKAGFSAVQTSPAQPAAGSGSWWWAYQPTGFYIGNTFGTKEELRSLCTEAESYGIKVVVDAIANHLARGSSSLQSEFRDSQYWHNFGEGINYNNRWEVTHKDVGSGLSDINTEHSYVQQYVVKYLNELKSVGVDGIRWDTAKHISLPSEGSNFWSEISKVDLYQYGEILGAPDDSGSDRNNGLMKEYTNYISVTDSDYGKTLRDSFNSGQAPSSYGNWSARGLSDNKLVYWAESHDNWSNNKDWGYSNEMSQNVIDRAYAIAASKNGATALYFSRPSEKAKDSIRMNVKGSTHYTSPEVAAVNHFHNAMVGQKEYYVNSNGCAVVCRPQGAVIVKGSGSGSVTVTNGGGTTAPGKYIDEITGNEWTVTSSTISGTIGPSGIAVVYNPVTTPTASVTPGTQSYKTDSLSLALSYANATSGQYSIDGGAYQNFTNGQKITIGAGLPYDTVTKVSVKASDGSTTSDIATYTYTKVDPTKTTKIYFDNSSYNWSNVYTYVYSSSTVNNGAWPGVKMERDSSTGLYYYEVPENLENGYAIFTESADATDNRYPADSEQGVSIGGSSKILKANHTWSDYSGSTTTPATTTPATTAPITTTPQEQILIGDVDLNGSVEVRDATLVQLYSASLRTLNAKQLIAGDTDRDGRVNVRDATNIQMYCAHLGDSASVGEYTDGGQITTEPKTEPTTMVSDKTVVYFNNTDNWSKVNVHYWNDSDTTTWPGNEMTKVSGNIYKYEVPNGMKGIIFNNGNGTQTSDLTMPTQSNMMYDYSSNTWSTYN